MTEVEHLIPTSGLQAWHKYESGVSGHNIIYDYSGNSRTIQCAAGNEPVLTANVQNGQPAWYFNGSRTPLAYTGSFTPKHVFIVASYDGATFPASGGAGEYAGLLSGLATGNSAVLIGDPTTTKFFNLSYGAGHEYRRRDAVYAESNMQAAMSGAHAVLEVSLSTGWSLDGIQIGKDRTFANRLWKGWFFESLFYNRVLTAAERFEIYCYFAIKFQIWKRVSSGLNVFPFQPNWSRPLAVDKRVLSSVAVSGAFKGRTKGTKKIGIEPQFEDRIPEEYDTAVAFWDEHHPGSSFIFRDDAFSPSRDTEMRFTTGVSSTDFDFRSHNYSFQAEQV